MRMNHTLLNEMSVQNPEMLMTTCNYIQYIYTVSFKPIWALTYDKIVKINQSLMIHHLIVAVTSQKKKTPPLIAFKVDSVAHIKSKSAAGCDT